MNESPNPYSSLISSRSRRLRTVGWVLLAFIIGLFLYGYFKLMPELGGAKNATEMVASGSVIRTSPETPLTPRAKRVVKFKAAVAILFWGVELLLVCALVFVAWLDVREVSKTYIQQRRKVWSQSVKDETGSSMIEYDTRSNRKSDKTDENG